MRKFWALLRVNFRAMLSAFSFGRSKKKAAGGIGTLVLLGGLALYISGVYSFMLAEMLQSLNLSYFLVPLMAMMACLMSLMFTAFAASNIIFGGKDNDLVLSIPVSVFTVMLSRVLALYLENLVFVGLWILPTAVVYYIGAGGVSLWTVFCFVIIILLLPLLCTLLGVLVGYLMALVSTRFARKALLSNLMYFIFFFGILALSTQMNKLPVMLLENAGAVLMVLHSWLLPFGLILDMLSGGFAALLFFIIVCVVPFLLIVYAISTRYKKILTGLTSHHTRSDYRLQNAGIHMQGQFFALLKKESGRYFGTPLYVFNTGFGVIMILGAAAYACVARGTVVPIIAMMGGMEGVLPIFVMALSFVFSTICTTSISISLEGKTLWILKEAPVAASTLFAIKALFNVLVAWPLTAICLLVLGVLYGVAAADILILLLFTFLMACYIACSGLFINLLFPKMDSPNDALIIKQSAGAVFGIFGGWIATGLGILLYLPLGKALGFRGFLLVCCALMLVLCVVLWRYLVTRGTRKLLAL